MIGKIFSYLKQPGQSSDQSLILAISLMTTLLALNFYSTPANARQQTEDRAETDQAIVMNSGSTNTSGYRIVIAPDGQLTYNLFRRRGQISPNDEKEIKTKLPDHIARKFYHDLSAAMPLSQWPKHGCAKSRSFGSTTVINYRGEQSPDLSCEGLEPPLMELKKDIQEILASITTKVDN